MPWVLSFLLGGNLLLLGKFGNRYRAGREALGCGLELRQCTPRDWHSHPDGRFIALTVVARGNRGRLFFLLLLFLLATGSGSGRKTRKGKPSSRPAIGRRRVRRRRLVILTVRNTRS